MNYKRHLSPLDADERAHKDRSMGIELTPYQLLIWVGQRLHPEVPMFTNAGYLLVHCPISVSYYRKACIALVQSSDALRTVITEVTGIPKQVVLRKIRFGVDFVDFSRAANPRKLFARWSIRRCRKPLRLDRCLFDLALVKLAPRLYAAYHNVHHIVSDACTVYLMNVQLCTLYDQVCQGKMLFSPSKNFSSYIQKELRQRASPRARAAAQYWNEKMRVAAEPLRFYGRNSTTRANVAVIRKSWNVGKEVSKRVREVARTVGGIGSEEALVHNFWGAVVAAFLFRASNSRTIVLGVPFHNRRGWEDVLGLFMQILPVSLRVEEGDSIASLSSKMAVEHIRALRRRDFRVGNPILQKLYDVEYNYMPWAVPSKFANSPCEYRWLQPGWGMEALAIHVTQTEEGIYHCDLDFRGDVFDRSLQKRALEDFRMVANEAIGGVAQPIGRIRSHHEWSVSFCDAKSSNETLFS